MLTTGHIAGLLVSGEGVKRLTFPFLNGFVGNPRVMGIDDWSWRHSSRYGTIMVDLRPTSAQGVATILASIFEDTTLCPPSDISLSASSPRRLWCRGRSHNGSKGTGPAGEQRKTRLTGALLLRLRVRQFMRDDGGADRSGLRPCALATPALWMRYIDRVGVGGKSFKTPAMYNKEARR
ncbi:hypothetical protein IE4803_PB00051 (plasmid) [Rhizobium etli bv. phaseoli str. IE4803]|nr:hypothetical protein IE4803_PB00051 [Rhizobium etli bv. phaseoli str. IE4803]ARO26660.1 hypothetical protein TAL182_PC00045 [Rhizobium sp. TAL182]